MGGNSADESTIFNVTKIKKQCVFNKKEIETSTGGIKVLTTYK